MALVYISSQEGDKRTYLEVLAVVSGGELSMEEELVAAWAADGET